VPHFSCARLGRRQSPGCWRWRFSTSLVFWYKRLRKLEYFSWDGVYLRAKLALSSSSISCTLFGYERPRNRYTKHPLRDTLWTPVDSRFWSEKSLKGGFARITQTRSHDNPRPGTICSRRFGFTE
jgi:hypothetical protein